MVSENKTTREISHQEAREIAHRLICGAFNRDNNRPRFTIPANHDRDDDLLMLAYIEQQERRNG
ncbi:hypothetical protein JL101_035845 (plasmid) [Skermanella rosea]|uniref:hypothetical protein n=1 Tax=Skermanella rosea TaxID=1817965 RepID=UPI0019322876|nr:hypothetical protein [Skermanella rosea]UEM08026.1 hypothetical protein JL101_035845 [Skermanella rosea]